MWLKWADRKTVSSFLKVSATLHINIQQSLSQYKQTDNKSICYWDIYSGPTKQHIPPWHFLNAGTYSLCKSIHISLFSIKRYRSPEKAPSTRDIEQPCLSPWREHVSHSCVWSRIYTISKYHCSSSSDIKSNLYEGFLHTYQLRRGASLI